MGNFKRSGGFGGPRRGGFKGGDRNEEREMFSATCSQCQNRCEVPFRPNGKKPVLCRDCFRAEGGGDSAPRGFSRGGDRPSYKDRDSRGSEPRFAPKTDDGVKRQLEAINDKLETLIQILKAGNR